MTPVAALTELPSEAGSAGASNGIRFGIGTRPLSGRDAGILSFELACASTTAAPVFRVHWWGDDRSAADELNSVRFAVEPGRLVVPLDALPRWLLLDRIGGLRIAPDTADACQGMRIRDAVLSQRNAVAGASGGGR